MNAPDLSIVIPNYNGECVLTACLDSLLSPSGISKEVFVVDNASKDGSRDLVRKSYPGVRLMEQPLNMGFGAACNRGAALSTGRYLLFLNSDTVVQRNALADLVCFADRHSEMSIGALGPLLRDRSGSPVHSFGGFPSALGQLGIWADRLSGGYEKRVRQTAARQGLSHFAVDYVTGAALLVPRAVFERIGGFDETFFLYFEDTELQARMAKAGYGRYVLCGPAILHLGNGGKQRSNEIRVLTYRGLLRYHQLRMPANRFRLYRLLFSFFAILHLMNVTYRPIENARFVAACLRESLAHTRS